MRVFSMANDSGLNPVTPNSSVGSCTAVPIAPCSRPSPPVSHTTSRRAPGTLAWRRPWGCCMLGAVSPRPLLALAEATSTCAGPDPALPGSLARPPCAAFRGAGTSGKAISGFRDPTAPRCLVPAWPSSPVPRACWPWAAYISLLHHLRCCLWLCCPCSLLNAVLKS